jgi:transposase-like protein
VRLGAREDDWLELGRELSSRGLAAPRLIVADGAPGLTSAIDELWPRADRQHCAVHRLRNLLAKLPKAEHDRVRRAYWKALNEATGVKDGKLRLQVLTSEFEHSGYEAAARCFTDDLDVLSCTCGTHSGTANDAGQPISSRDHSARSAGAPK